VDAFDTNLLVSEPTTKILDLITCSVEDLHDIEIPLDMEVGMHHAKCVGLTRIVDIHRIRRYI